MIVLEVLSSKKNPLPPSSSNPPSLPPSLHLYVTSALFYYTGDDYDYSGEILECTISKVDGFRHYSDEEMHAVIAAFLGFEPLVVVLSNSRRVGFFLTKIESEGH